MTILLATLGRGAASCTSAQRDPAREPCHPNSNSSGRRRDVALETTGLVIDDGALIFGEVLGPERALEELLVDGRTPTAGVLVLVALGDGGLETTGPVWHHDVPVRVVDGARKCNGIAVTGEHAGGLDAVHLVDLGDDAEERISCPFLHPHNPRTVLPGEDDHVDPGAVFGLRTQLREPEVILGGDLALIELAERTRPREESFAVEEVEFVVARARQDGALGIGEAFNGQRDQFQDCTCRIG